MRLWNRVSGKVGLGCFGALLLALGTVPSGLWAQDADGAAASETAAPETGSAAAGAADFAARFDAWKQELAELRALQLEYKLAKPDDRAGIREKYDAQLKEAQTLVGPLKEAAMAAYADGNQEAGDLLAQFLRSDVKTYDDYEDAIGIGKLLIEHNYPKNEVYALAGVAAFATNDFDLAEKFLKTAQEKGAIDQVGLQYLNEIPNYRQLWAEEQKLRTAEAEADDLPRVLLKTNQGDITIELFENEAPNTVANFISLVEKKFYDGIVFHRVLGGFMAQGGDPTGTGSGGPGYYIECECDNENHRKHFRGVLSMAHAGRDTGGSQFFLTFVPTAHLNGQHTVFGRVVEGMDVLSRLKRIDPSQSSGVDKDKIISAEVVRKRDHEYLPKTLPER